MPSCSVIIVSYQTGPLLFAVLKSALRQQQLAEVIVVDNGNAPEIFARLQQMTLSDPRLKMMTGQGNIGVAKARNLAAKNATGDYLLFLHPGCLLPPEALADCIIAFEQTPDAILAGCWLVNPDGSEQREGRQPLLTPKMALRHLFYRQKPAGQMPREIHEVPAISSAFMCVRKSSFVRLGAFDEEFFLYGEDLDFCMRVKKSGGKTICVPRVKVAYVQKSSGIFFTARDIKWHGGRGLMRYFGKHFRGEYFPGFLTLVNGFILAAYAATVAKIKLHTWFRYKPDIQKSVAKKRLMVLASGFAELPETKQFFGKTILVTGATSQIGLCVMRRLIAAGASVLAMSRGDAIPFEHEGLRWIKSDLDDTACTLHGYYADMAVHCAPLWYLPPALDMLKEAGVARVIAFGTTSLFARVTSKNWYEKDMVVKLGEAENAIEKECAARGMRWTILRPTLVYGVGLDVNITSLYKFIRFFRFFAIYPPAVGRRHPVHADDLALAVVQAMDTPATYAKSYNLSGSEVLTYRKMVERIFQLCRRKIRIIPCTLLPSALDAVGRIVRQKHINGEIAYRMNDDLIFFHDAARQDFKFAPRAFLSGGMRDIEGF